MPRAYFITGTDTGVGKTLAASALLRGFTAQGLRTVGMKPVASGSMERSGEKVWEDVEQLQAQSSLEVPLELRNPYRFDAPIAPHIAALHAGDRIDTAVIARAYRRLEEQADMVIVEGAGGFYAPLNETETMADLALQLKLPVILVVAMRLGCINQALLTQRAIRDQGLEFAGWIANRIDPAMLAPDENLASLEQRLHAPLLGVLPYLEPPSVQGALLHLYLERL
ncbi:MAG TPA: dethiobiotin synthase [Burkholderiales bacterium]|nr:dethiobiotin synthase [Burkholderiales bacterium]